MFMKGKITERAQSWITLLLSIGQWNDPLEWRSSNQAHDDPFAILGSKDLGILQQVAKILLSDASKHHPRHNIPGFQLPLKIPILIRVTNYPPS